MNQNKVKNDDVIAAMVRSSMFRVRHDGRIETCYQWRGIRECVVPWFICDRADGKGYRYVSFRSNRVKAHRLAFALYHNQPELLGLEINHIDGNKLNNSRDNLELCTASRQSKHAFDIGLNPSRGTSHRLAKLNPETVRELRKLRLLGVPYSRLAVTYGVTPRAIKLACNGETWAHVD